MTRFLSRDLPQHKHTASAKSSEPPRARNCILSPPLARHPLTTCACAYVLRLGHFCNPLLFHPRARSLSLALLYFALLSRIVLRFFVFYFLPPSPLFLQQEKKTNFTLCELWQLSKIREKIHHFRRRRRSPIPSADNAPPRHTWGRFCVKAPHQPTSHTHSNRQQAAPDNERS